MLKMEASDESDSLHFLVLLYYVCFFYDAYDDMSNCDACFQAGAGFFFVQQYMSAFKRI